MLPIGGLKEKLLAAMRGGIRTVIIPEENRKDLADIPKSSRSGMKIVPVTLDRRGARPRAGTSDLAAATGACGRREAAREAEKALSQPDVTH